MYKLLWKVLNKKEKKQSWYFLFLTFINTIIEVSIVLMIVPLTQILLNQPISLPYFGEVSYFNNFEYYSLVIYSVSLLLLVFLIKNIFFSYYTYWQFKYSGLIEFRLSSQLLEKYIYRPYIYHLNSNSGILTNNVLNEIQYIAGNVKQILILTSETIILILIACVLIIYEPQGSISVIIISVFMLLLLNSVQKKYMTNFGYKRYLSMGESNKNLIQGLQNIKDIKLLGREEYFVKSYSKNFINATKYKIFYDTLSAVPKPISEVILVTAFAVLVSILVGKNDPNIIILTTSLFLIATYRLLPSIVRITSAYQSIQLRRKTVTALMEDLLRHDIEISNKNLKNENKNFFTFEKKINLEKISFHYPNSEKRILNDVELMVNKGEMIGIVGPSGSGKTTLIDILLGLIKPTSGKIIVDDKVITNDNVKGWQNIIGYVPQSPTFVDESIKKNIALGIEDEYIDKELLNNSISQSNLNEFLKDQENGIETIIGEKGVRISGGQKQRIAIARALYKNPQIIIFDEATSSLDEKNENEIIKNILLVKKIKTTLVIAHKLSILEKCDKIMKIENGKIIDFIN